MSEQGKPEGANEGSAAGKGDWVKRYGDFTVDSVFARLHDAVKQDVGTYNELPEKRRASNMENILRAFEVSGRKGGEFSVSLMSPRFKREVVFRVGSPRWGIQVAGLDGMGFWITPRWDMERSEVVYEIEGRESGFHEIVQRAIGRLLFEGFPR